MDNPSTSIEQKLKPFSEPEHQPFQLGNGPGSALLIHGFPGTPKEMRSLGAALAEHGWCSFGPLLPGFGPNISELTKYSKKDWLVHSHTSYQQACNGHSPCALIGYSMGGALALCLAEQLRPDYLVLISPFWNLPGFLPMLVTLARWVMPNIQPFKEVDFQDPDVRRQLHQFLPQADLDDPTVQQTIRTEFVLPLKTINEILRLGRKAYQAASKIDIPTYIIQGKDDPLVRPDQTRRLVKRLTANETTYLEIPGGHNLIHLDGAEQTSEAIHLITQFLSEAKVPD